MKIFESAMCFPFGTAIGVVLLPGKNNVSDEEATALLALEDTRQRVAEDLLIVRDAEGKEVDVPAPKRVKVTPRKAPKAPSPDDEPVDK